jgi:hypothetical protein
LKEKPARKMHCVCSQQDEANEGGGGSIWDLLRCGRMKKGHKFTMPKGERSEYTSLDTTLLNLRLAVSNYLLL